MQPGGFSVRIILPTSHRPDEMGEVVLVGMEPVSERLVDLVVGGSPPSTG